MPDPPISAAAVRKSDSDKHDFGWEKFRLKLMVSSVCGNVEDVDAVNAEEIYNLRPDYMMFETGCNLTQNNRSAIK